MIGAIDFYDRGHVYQRVPFGDGQLCLFDPPKLSNDNISNLVLFDRIGAPQWSAQYFQPGDIYVQFQIDDTNMITAWTFSGYKLRIDAKTGRWSDPVFTK